MLKYSTTNTVVSFAASLYINNGCPYSEQKFNRITIKNREKLQELYENNEFDKVAEIYKLKLTGDVAMIRGLGLFIFHPVINGNILPLRKDGQLKASWQTRNDVEITLLHFKGEGDEK